MLQATLPRSEVNRSPLARPQQTSSIPQRPAAVDNAVRLSAIPNAESEFRSRQSPSTTSPRRELTVSGIGWDTNIEILSLRWVGFWFVAFSPDLRRQPAVCRIFGLGGPSAAKLTFCRRRLRLSAVCHAPRATEANLLWSVNCR